MNRIKSYKKNLFLRNPKKIKLIQFWSAWCGSCMDVTHLNDFYKSNINLEIYRLNVDEHQFMAIKYSVVILPTYLFFVGLKPNLVLVGEQSKETLSKALKSILNR